MDFSNYNFNSDNEIPIEVLKARFITTPLKRSNNATNNRATTVAIPDKAKRIMNGIMALVILFSAYISLFEIARSGEGYTASAFEYLFSGNHSMINRIIELFSAFDSIGDVNTFIYLIVLLPLYICSAYATIRLIISSISVGISAVKGFFRNDSLTIEKGVATMLKRTIVFLFFSILLNDSVYSYGFYEEYTMNSDFGIVTLLLVLVSLGVAITKAVIRYKMHRVSDKNLKQHILRFVAQTVTLALFLSLPLSNYYIFSIRETLFFFENMSQSLTTLNGILTILLIVMVDYVIFGLPAKFCISYYSDGLRLLTSGETLDAETSSLLLNEDLTKKNFVKYIVIGAVGFIMSIGPVAEMFDLTVIDQLFMTVRTTFVYIFIVSLIAEITLRIFKKKG